MDNDAICTMGALDAMIELQAIIAHLPPVYRRRAQELIARLVAETKTFAAQEKKDKTT